MTNKLKVLDLFSGIGGFSVGLDRAGMETVAFCEKEIYPTSILMRHWPGVPVYADVKELIGESLEREVGKIDVICGGVPCQPFSTAGKQKGKDDDRHLWPEMFRLIQEIRPNWVIIENVTGFVRMALDGVLFDLESEGYDSQSFVIPACAVNAIHRRDRVWIVAHAEHNGSHGTEITRGAIEAGNDNQGREVCSGKLEGGGEPRGSGDIQDKDVAYTRTETGGSETQPGFRTADDGVPSRLAGFRLIDEPTASPVIHKDDKITNRVARLKALGNAVVAPIPEIIGRAIMTQHNKIAENEN